VFGPSVEQRFPWLLISSQVEIFAPHDLRILIQLQEMLDDGRTANKDPLDDGVEIADIVVVVVEIAVAVSCASALVERALQLENRRTDLLHIHRHLCSFQKRSREWLLAANHASIEGTKRVFPDIIRTCRPDSLT